MKNNILKQAIADAKLVRETALANAKLSLEEQFKPQLQEMFAAKLRNAVNEDNDATSAIGTGLTVDEPAPKLPSAAARNSSNIENKGLEVDDVFDGPSGAPKAVHENDMPFGDEDEDGDVDAIDASMSGASPAAPAAPTPDMGGTPDMAAPTPDMGGAPDMGMDAGMGGGDELDLEAIIRELEAEANGTDAGMDASAPAMEGFDDPMAGAKVDGPVTVKETLSGKPDEGTHKDGKSPTAVDGVNGGKKVSPGQEVTGTKAETMSEGEEEIDLDEILREMEAVETAPVAEMSKIAAENAELKKSLREHQEAIAFYRNELKTQNMFNAKLLYTNKLMRNGTLTVEQKMKIVETFDRATTLREVKLIYTTLAESFATRQNKTPVAKANAKAITEGLASKPVASTKPKSTQVLTEDNAQRARLMKLAGIRIL